MRRRTVLAAVGSSVAGVLGGCSAFGSAQPSEAEVTPVPVPTTTTQTTTDQPTDSTQTIEPTGTPEPVELTVEGTYALGERYTDENAELDWMGPWTLAFTGFDLYTTYRAESQEQIEEYDLPDDRQLLVATLEITNPLKDRRLYEADPGRFAALADGEAFPDRSALPFREGEKVPIPEGVDAWQLARAESPVRHRSHGRRIDGGTTVTESAVMILPRSVTRSARDKVTWV